MRDVIFIIVAVFAVGGAYITAFSRSIVNSALGLLLSLVFIAGIYIFLSADFVAIAQILIYVGGVLVLLLFGIMLTSGGTNIFSNNPLMKKIPAALFVAVFIGLAVFSVKSANLEYFSGTYTSTTRQIGHLLLRDYVLAFELVSVLIVVLIIGAGVMLRKELVVKINEAAGKDIDKKEGEGKK